MGNLPYIVRKWTIMEDIPILLYAKNKKILLTHFFYQNNLLHLKQMFYGFFKENNPTYLDNHFYQCIEEGFMNWWLEMGYVNINTFGGSWLSISICRVLEQRQQEMCKYYICVVSNHTYFHIFVSGLFLHASVPVSLPVTS